MEGFSAQDELPPLGSLPTGSVPQGLVRVCKNQQKHKQRSKRVYQEPNFNTAGGTGGAASSHLIAVSRCRGCNAHPLCSHRRQMGAWQQLGRQPPTDSTTPDLVGMAISDAGVPACHCTAAECPPTSDSHPISPKDQGHRWRWHCRGPHTPGSGRHRVCPCAPGVRVCRH